MRYLSDRDLRDIGLYREKTYPLPLYSLYFLMG